MEEELLQTLRNIGLTDGEAKTYLALLSIGTSTVGSIIKKSGISASKVYYILDKLINKGLVSMIVKEKKKIFTASNPERILEYLDEEKQRIDKNKKNAEKIMPVLKLKKESISKLPIVELSKGMKGCETFYDEIYETMKKGDKYIATSGKRITFRLQHYWFKQSKLLSEKNIPQYLAYEHYAWYKKDPKVHRRSERTNYYPKVLDKKYKDLPTIVIIGDKTIINDIDDDNKMFTLLIRNKNLTNAMEKLLEIILDSGKVPEGFKEN